MDAILTHLHQVTGLGVPTLLRLIQSLTVIFIAGAIRFLVVKMVWRRTTDVRVRYKWRKATSYIVSILGLLVVGRIWFQGVHSVVTYLGILSAGLAIALQDIISNFAGWAFILWRRPFAIGDRIQVGEHRGDVIDIRIFQFTILEIGNWVDADQSTGRILHVPNRDVISKVTANYGTGFEYIWDEIPVLITFESNWEKAKEILSRVVNEHAEHLTTRAEKKIKETARRYLIFYNKLTPAVFSEVRDSGVMLTLRFLCEPRKRRAARQAMWEDILKEFAKHKDIDFAYPTQRFFNHATEGKMPVS